MKDFAEARKVMGEHLEKDEGLYIAYKANIAMWLKDHTILNIEKCNELAEELISLIWSIAPSEQKDNPKG